MIFSKYLISEILKNQIIALVILFLVFFSQRFLRLFSLLIGSIIPKFLIFVFFGLGIPEIIKLILPLSLFFGILVTFNYLHVNNEVVAMYACGIGSNFIIRGVFFLSAVSVFFCMINVFFFSPFCVRYQNQIISKYQSEFNGVRLFERQFCFLKDIHSVFYVGSLCKNKFENIFLVQVLPNNCYWLITADYGYVEKSFDGLQWVVFDSGHCYSWSNNNEVIVPLNVYVSDFNRYKFLINRRVIVNKKNDLVGGMFINELWFSSSLEARVELHWRLTLIFIVFAMAMIVFPLSLKLKTSYLFNIFPSVILYLMFFLLQIFLRSNISKGYVDLIWIWVVNFFYIFVAIILNSWDSVFFRNFRWNLKLVSK